MLKKPVVPWQTPLPPAVRWLSVPGPFSGTQVSHPKRALPGRPLLLRCRCAAPVTVTVQYRRLGQWVAGEQALAAEWATTVAPLVPSDLRLRVDADGTVEGVIELVEA
jgi:hypothetical protein